MRKIIEGKSYDTDTAALVGEWSAECCPTDFEWFREELYRKRTGEYFVWGEGGPQSRYAVHRYGSWSGSEAITPISYEDARKWAERHLTADEYESEFGEVEEDGSQVVLGVRVSAAAKAALARKASETGRTQSEIVDELLLSI